MGGIRDWPVFQRMPAMGTLQWALLFSIALHLALLTVRFVNPQAFNRLFEDTPLEVILVNAKGKTPPVKAQAIAQTALEGGGDALQGRASSLFAVSPQSQEGDVRAQLASGGTPSLQAQQNILLSQIRSQLTALEHHPLSDSPHQPQQAQKEQRRQMLALLGEIEKRIHTENSRPKKKYLSPAVKEAAYAVYYDTMRRAIETRGTSHFPEIAGKKLYGVLTMIVTVNANGQVIDAEMVESSGNPALDARAQEIARTSGPFGPFGEAMRRSADQLAIVSRFHFAKDETLQTHMVVPP